MSYVTILYRLKLIARNINVLDKLSRTQIAFYAENQSLVELKDGHHKITNLAFKYMYE